MPNRVLIAAPKSGSGKTTITIALLSAFKKAGVNIKSFKCGPDYIDPMFHERVINIASRNLDFFFCDEDQINAILTNDDSEDCYALLEGAMGLYDGLSGLELKASAYEIASITKSPVVLVIDAHGCGRTIISLIKGILLDDKDNLICGVILNKISKSFYQMISPLIEKETGIECLGYIEKCEDINFKSRHLGLMLPSQIEDYREKVEKLGDMASECINLNRLIKIMESAKSLKPSPKNKPGYIAKKRLRLGVAADEVFCFYYQENLDAFLRRNVEIVEFSPVHDLVLPDNLDGLLVGGGYPELKLKELSENVGMKSSVKDLLDKGIPSLFECGGFMYLHDEILDDNGKAFSMVGSIRGSCINTGKLGRFGYITLTMPDGKKIRAHEFHYFDSNNNGEAAMAKKPAGNREWKCGHFFNNSFFGFPHLYYESCPEFVDEFVKKMELYHESELI